MQMMLLMHNADKRTMRKMNERTGFYFTKLQMQTLDYLQANARFRAFTPLRCVCVCGSWVYVIYNEVELLTLLYSCRHLQASQTLNKIALTMERLSAPWPSPSVGK